METERGCCGQRCIQMSETCIAATTVQYRTKGVRGARGYSSCPESYIILVLKYAAIPPPTKFVEPSGAVQYSLGADPRFPPKRRRSYWFALGTPAPRTPRQLQLAGAPTGGTSPPVFCCSGGLACFPSLRQPLRQPSSRCATWWSTWCCRIGTAK